jgi:chorismate-pyruvate lyase
MENVTFVEVETMSGAETHAIIAHADGSFTSMLKATYEAQQVEHLTEIIPSE